MSVVQRIALTALMLLLPAIISGCGYQNPYLAAKRQEAVPTAGTPPFSPIKLYARLWENQTNELGLQLVFYNALYDWFQNSRQIQLVSREEEAEYLLTGEIIATNEGFTRGTVRLTVGYRYQNRLQNETLWQVPSRTYSESFYVSDDAAQTRDNKRAALTKIADNLAESIYMRILHSARNRPTVPAQMPNRPAEGTDKN